MVDRHAAQFAVVVAQQAIELVLVRGEAGKRVHGDRHGPIRFRLKRGIGRWVGRLGN
jgi:hypothetical protein